MKHISIDPGESCGWAVWTDGLLEDCGTDPLWHVVDAVGEVLGQTLNVQSLPHLNEAFDRWDELIVEDWAIYPWEAENHALDWDSCRTARGIGAFELICRRAGKAIHLQPASIKDDAVAGGAEHLFDSPLHENRHANDAIMHGTYYFARQTPNWHPRRKDGG